MTPPKCKDTKSPIPKSETPASYAETLHKQCKKYDSGYEQFVKIRVRGAAEGEKPNWSRVDTASFSYPNIFPIAKVSPSSYD